MKRKPSRALWYSLAALSCTVVAGLAGYGQAAKMPALNETDLALAPTIPRGVTGVQIDFPPQPEIASATATDGSPTPAQALNHIWETNAKQPLALLPQPLTEPNWTITGVVQQVDQVRVMVLFQGEPQARFYKVGDVLPGGSKLAWVKPGAIGVITPKRQKVEVPILEGSNATAPAKTPASAGKALR